MSEYDFAYPSSNSAAEASNTPRVVDESVCRQIGALADPLSLVPLEPMEVGPNDHLRRGLKHDIIGQDPAIDAIIAALDRGILRDSNKPVASLLFLGPTGVGKTETVRALDERLNPGKSQLTRIDCSNYQDSHQVDTLTGSPPGYVGYGDRPVLHPDNIKGNNRIILFDEFEKASPALHKLALQIMEEGQLMMQNGRDIASFNKSLIIFTSNIGAFEISRLLHRNTVGFSAGRAMSAAQESAEIEAKVQAALRESVAPEFIGRLDGRIVFQPLSDDNLVKVLHRYIERMGSTFEKKNMRLHVSNELEHAIVRTNPERRQYGGRTVVKAFQKTVLSRLGQHVSSGSIPKNSTVYATLRDTANTEPDFDLWVMPKEGKPAAEPIKQLSAGEVVSFPVIETGGLPDKAPWAQTRQATEVIGSLATIASHVLFQGIRNLRGKK